MSGQKQTGGRQKRGHEERACVCVCVCVLTLLVTLEFGKGSVPVKDGPVEAQLVVQGLLGILQTTKKGMDHHQMKAEQRSGALERSRRAGELSLVHSKRSATANANQQRLGEGGSVSGRHYRLLPAEIRLADVLATRQQ